MTAKASALAIGLACLVGAAPARAWECPPTPIDGDEIFEGVVDGVRVVPVGTDGGEYKVVTFRITNVLKGTLQTGRVEFSTGLFAETPGYPFLCQTAYEVHAVRASDGSLRTNTCTKTRPLDPKAPSVGELEFLLYSSRSRLTEKERDAWRRKLVCEVSGPGKKSSGQDRGSSRRR